MFTQKIILNPRAIFVRANNANFPKLSNFPAARMLMQDIDAASPYHSPRISYEKLKSDKDNLK